MMMRTLSSTLIQGSTYSVVTSVLTLLLSFIRLVVTLQFLTPAEVGEAAFAIAILYLTHWFREFGLDTAVIQYPDDNTPLHQLLSTHFVLRIIFYIIFVFLCFTLSFTYVYSLVSPDLFWYLWTLISAEAFVSLGATSTAYIRKAFLIHHMSMIRIITSLTMKIAGCVMAWIGFGSWAIIVPQAIGLIFANIYAILVTYKSYNLWL